MAKELIWPKQNHQEERQRFRVVGVRFDREPALLPCRGSCGLLDVTWTKHRCTGDSWYKCTHCGSTRQWGLLETHEQRFWQ